MDSDKIPIKTIVLEAFQEIAEVLHKSDLEFYLFYRLSKPVQLDSEKSGHWGIHSIQTNLFVARNRASKQLQEQIKTQYAQLLISVKDAIAGIQKPTYCRDVAANLSQSGRFALFSSRAIQTIVYLVSRKRGAIQNSNQDKTSENPLIIGPIAKTNKSTPPETVLKATRSLTSRNEIVSLMGNKPGERSTFIEKKAIVTSMPISISRSHTDIHEPFFPSGQARDASEIFTSEDIVYLQDREDLLRSKRNHHHWQEDFSRTADMDEGPEAFEPSTQTSGIVSAVSKPFPMHTEIPIDTKKKAKGVQGDALDYAFTSIENDSRGNFQKAFTDFKRKAILESGADPDNEADSNFQGAMLDDSPPWTGASDDFENCEENWADDSYSVEGEIDKSIETDDDLFPASDHEPPDEWEQYAEELDEFEAQAHQFQEDDIQTDGKLSREQRAMQVAIEVGQRFEWDQDGIELLADVFIRYGWSATRKSIETAFEDDLSPEELLLAMEVRELWQESGVFANACIAISSTRPWAAYNVLSWPMALALVRLFAGVPDLDEIELYLNRRLDLWRENASLFRRFPVFSGYLYHCICTSQNEMDTDFGWPGAEGEYS